MVLRYLDISSCVVNFLLGNFFISVSTLAKMEEKDKLVVEGIGKKILMNDYVALF